MNVVSFLIIVIILVIFIVLSMFIEETNMKIAYWLVIGLLLLTITNMYMSIVYYIKLREDPGSPGPRGPKGEKGPKGDPGKCTFSEKCGIEGCNEKIFDMASNYYPSISIECLKDNKRCTDDEMEKAKPVTKQIYQLIDECKKTKRAEGDFIARIRPVLANMESSN